ncbi:hypothetical protein ACFTXJ_21970 [Streptomyces zhihengii]|uniref:LppU/SCO3897 family protein n=1 Tax=Streptomyces zhihengii TaxID=1818004 RepID=UPI00362892F3
MTVQPPSGNPFAAQPGQPAQPAQGNPYATVPPQNSGNPFAQGRPQGQPQGQPQNSGNPFAPGAPQGGPAGVPGGCQFCGSVPAAEATVRARQGMIIANRTQKVEGHFCRSCGMAVHRELSAKTLLQGWWSVQSFLLTPFTLIGNLSARGKFKKLAEPSGGFQQPMTPGKPIMRRAAAVGVLVPLALVGAIVTAVVMDDSAGTASAGDCVRNNGTTINPDIAVVECGSAEAQFKVAERHDGTAAQCDRNRFSEYREYGGSSDFTLCLEPLP